MGTPLLALAQNAGVNTSASASVDAQSTRAGTGANATVSAKLSAKDETAKQKANQEIKRRVEALNALVARTNAMVRVSAEFKASLNSAVQAQISAFSQLQQKIDTDADAATLKSDIETVTETYRVYALVLPQVRIAAAADRIVNLTTMFIAVGTKLQARIAAAQAIGADVSALSAALTDLGAKLQDAQTQAQTAITSTVSLQPDQGDKTLKATNDKALAAAKANIVAAHKDLADARKDVAAIISGLNKISASATTSASTQ